MKNSIILLMTVFSYMIRAQVGVGTTDPKVHLDARALGNSAIGIGDTNQTASNAEAGALKYNSAAKKMMYSDGVNWVEMAGTPADVFVPKVVASGRSGAQQTVAAGGVYRVWNFSIVQANDGNWNPANNTYTVPVSGFYQLSIAGGIRASLNNNASNWIVQINNGGTLQNYSLSDQLTLAAIYFARKGGTIVLFVNAGSIISFGSTHCLNCNTPAETYLIDTGATFSVVALGS